MEKKLKELLLRDICARIPDGLKVLYNDSLECQPSGLIKVNGRTCFTAFGVAMPLEIDEIKPYLRPMSSMTEEESKEYKACHCVIDEHTYFYPQMCTLANELNMFDWLNEHHFDYRGLIEKGLALEAPEEMYN